MIHDLSARYYREFSGSPDVVRFGMAREGNAFKPVLLIKTASLTLKYLIRLRSFRLLFWKFQPAGHLWCGLQIADDPVHPCTLWSIVESDEELTALGRFARDGEIPVFLFNEDVVNVVSANVAFGFQQTEMISFLADVKVAPDGMSRQYHDAVDSLLAPGRTPPLLQASPVDPCNWIEIRSTLITNRLIPSELSMITGNEGNQQEVLAAWVFDALGLPAGVCNPVVHEQTQERELSDLIISYDHGCFLLESKALSILDRRTLPNRSTLIRDVQRHVGKAVRQLKGACANIRRGLRVTDNKGQDLLLKRDQPIHCMVLVPDLSLFAEYNDFVNSLLYPLMNESNAFLHLLDPIELRRLVHNAGFIATNSRTLTPLMTFDGILIKRFELARLQPTPYFNFHLSLKPDF